MAEETICKSCHGTGLESYLDWRDQEIQEKCSSCYGKGYRLRSIGNLMHDLSKRVRDKKEREKKNENK